MVKYPGETNHLYPSLCTHGPIYEYLMCSDKGNELASIYQLGTHLNTSDAGLTQLPEASGLMRNEGKAASPVGARDLCGHSLSNNERS